MKKMFLFMLIVALCMSVCSQVWADGVGGGIGASPWEDNKLLADIVSVFADEALSVEEKTDKIMGLASHTEIESMMFYMLELLVKSPNANDECIACLKKCNRAYCSCVSGCDIDNDRCWSECLARFVACMIGCGECQWGAMY